MNLYKFFYRATVVRVVDGDTVDLSIDLGFSMLHQTRVRLHGVNTPESRTRDLEEKARGIAATEYVEEWLRQYDEVYIRTIKDRGGKYGRILAYIYSDEKMTHCLNEDIITSGHGVEYFGGARN